MGRRTIKLIVLLLVVLVLGGACLLLASMNKDEAAAPEQENLIKLAELSSEGVSAFNCSYNGATLSFSQTAGQWKYDGDPEFPLAQNTITTMIEAVAVVNADRKLDDLDDASAYGLDEPLLTLTVTHNGEELVFEVGDKNNYSGGYYLRYKGEIYMADETLMTVFAKDLFDYLNVTELPLLDDIVSFTVDGAPVTDEAAVNELAAAYSALVRGDVVDYRSKESYGFDGSEHTVVVNYNVETPITDENGYTSSTVDTQYSYSFKYAYVGEAAYMMLQDDELIYSASATEPFDMLKEANEAPAE